MQVVAPTITALTGRRAAVAAAALGLILGLTGDASAAQSASRTRPFAPAGAWNSPIPQRPALDPASARIAGYLGGERGTANLYDYGVPVYEADADTPRRPVQCTAPWGRCELEDAPVPLPEGARPSRGSDGAMVVVDAARGKVYDFWQLRRGDGGQWVASWGEVTELDGDGRDGATGAGVSVLSGVIRAREIRAGYIPHALTFSTDNACRAEHRYPAVKTDGRSSRADCIPQGARIQLDPSIDVDRIPGITPGERAVARALQTYGAYARDNGGARLALIFEDPAGRPDPYPSVGLEWDYHDMPHIPWGELRVLREWHGG